MLTWVSSKDFQYVCWIETCFLIPQSLTLCNLFDSFDKGNMCLILQECMKGSLAKARVLYAPVEEIGSEGRLLRASRIHI